MVEDSMVSYLVSRTIEVANERNNKETKEQKQMKQAKYEWSPTLV